VRLGFWLTHKKVTVTGSSLIPKDKPIIFAANHQNALMDPLSLACTNSHQSFWLARADIFKSKQARPILKYLRLLPVYRIRDGKENLVNNKEIFEQVVSILENKQTVALFPEAAHSGKRQMLPHKKAIPRIALEAEEKNQFSLDLQIVPVGIYYSHYWAFNRLLIVQYGEPIAVGKYEAEFMENPQKAMISLRDEIYQQIATLTLEINSKTHYQHYEVIRQLVSNAYSKTHFFNPDSSLQLFYSEIELADKLEQIEINRTETFENITAATNAYLNAAVNAGFSDELIEKAADTNVPLLLVQFLAAFLIFPAFVFGFIFNVLPYLIPRSIIQSKVKDTAFLSTFNFAIGLIVFPLFYLIEACLIFNLTNSPAISVIALVLMPYLGKIAYQIMNFYHHIYLKFAFLLGTKTKRNKIRILINQRIELINLVLENINR